eukprot:s1940_g9.t3
MFLSLQPVTVSFASQSRSRVSPFLAEFLSDLVESHSPHRVMTAQSNTESNWSAERGAQLLLPSHARKPTTCSVFEDCVIILNSYLFLPTHQHCILIMLHACLQSIFTRASSQACLDDETGRAMRIARAPTKLQTERFGTSISVLPAPRTVRPRAADSNDSGSVWQVVFRQVEPIDPARGPFLPVCEDLSQQASSPRPARDAAVGILPQGLGLWPPGMRRLPRPWEPGSGEICGDPGPLRRSGVRRERTVSSTPVASRPKRAGRALWKRLAEPRQPVARAARVYEQRSPTKEAPGHPPRREQEQDQSDQRRVLHKIFVEPESDLTHFFLSVA